VSKPYVITSKSDAFAFVTYKFVTSPVKPKTVVFRAVMFVVFVVTFALVVTLSALIVVTSPSKSSTCGVNACIYACAADAVLYAAVAVPNALDAVVCADATKPPKTPICASTPITAAANANFVAKRPVFGSSIFPKSCFKESI